MVRWIASILLLITMYCGCSEKSEPDKLSKSQNSEMRIISMAPNLTEILFALGVGESVVGVTKQCTWPPEATEKASIGSFWQPDIEAMLVLRPTFMVNLWFDQQAAVVSRMERIGCDVLTLRIETVHELYSALESIGQAVNKEPAAKEIVQRLKSKQDELAQKYAAGSDRPRVLWVIERYPLRVAGRDTFINELIEMAGGVNAIGPTQMQYPPISSEEVIGCMPDVIIEPVMDPKQLNQQRASAAEFYERYAVVPAVRNDRIYIVDGDLVSRLGPRLDQAAALIETCLWKDKSD